MPATHDANDDIGMVRAIREGALSENISREEVFNRLHPAPTAEGREEASYTFRGAMDTIGRKLNDVPTEELERELDKGSARHPSGLS